LFSQLEGPTIEVPIMNEAQTVNWQLLPETIVHGRIRRRIFNTDRVTLVRYEFPPGATFPRHAHSQAQVTLVLSGVLLFDYGDRVDRHEPGDLVSIPPYMPHEGRTADEPATIVCVLTPARREELSPVAADA
jgi:quercetin dioxygenase-like cupin family protein